MKVDISAVPDEFFRPNHEIGNITDVYFSKTAKIASELHDPYVTYAVFLRSPIIMAMDLAEEFLKRNYEGSDLSIRRFFPEGALVPATRKIAEIRGKFSKLAELETLFLQRIGVPCVAARRAYECAVALPNVPFIDMHARHGTGVESMYLYSYGAAVGSMVAKMNGATGFINSSTNATAPFFGQEKAIGTMPHALIGMFDALNASKQSANSDEEIPAFNSTLEALKMYQTTFPEEKTLTVLVDYNGREVTDSLECAKWWQESENKSKYKLAVRLDTHGGRYLETLDWNESVNVLKKWTHLSSAADIRDLAITGIHPDSFSGRDWKDVVDKHLFDTGVTAAAIVRVRKALDDCGFHAVQIIGSSGFDPLKCQIMANLRVSLDMVGTGSFMPSKTSSANATADIIEYDGVKCVKVGREYLHE